MSNREQSKIKKMLYDAQVLANKVPDERQLLRNNWRERNGSDTSQTLATCRNEVANILLSHLVKWSPQSQCVFQTNPTHVFFEGSVTQCDSLDLAAPSLKIFEGPSLFAVMAFLKLEVMLEIGGTRRNGTLSRPSSSLAAAHGVGFTLTAVVWFVLYLFSLGVLERQTQDVHKIGTILQRTKNSICQGFSHQPFYGGPKNINILRQKNPHGPDTDQNSRHLESNANALYLLGMTALELGKPGEAVSLLNKSLLPS